MLICVEGGRKETTFAKKTERERQKERQEKKYVVAVGGGGGEKKQRESQITPSSLPPCLPPPSWKHRVRALSLHILIMINAGSTTHTLKPRFWQGSVVVLCSGLWFCMEQLTLPSRLVKVKNHKLVKSQRGGRCG